jgi:hypothetical protein
LERTANHPSREFDITTVEVGEEFFLMKHPHRCARLFGSRMLAYRQSVMLVGAAAIATSLFCGLAWAQDSSVPMPDTGGYGLNDAPSGQDPGGFGYASPDDTNMPSTDMGAPPDSVSIPIPGGGQVSVDGPEAPQDNGLSTNPGSNWGIQGQAPASQGVGPLGP